MRDERILRLDGIVQEIKQSEEWEDSQMNIWQMGVAAGREEGVEKGEAKVLIAQICKKLRKGKTPEAIAEEVEEPLEKVLKICALAEKVAPEYPEEQVYLAWEAGEEERFHARSREEFKKIGK